MNSKYKICKDIQITFNIIVSQTSDGGISCEGEKPFSLIKEMQRFEQITLNTYNSSIPNIIIMGYKTWISFFLKKNYFSKRIKIIIDHDVEQNSYELTKLNKNKIMFSVNNFEDALYLSGQLKKDNIDLIYKVWVIGGSKIFNESIMHPLLNKIYLTKVHIDIKCDKFFPKIEDIIFFRLKKQSKCTELINIECATELDIKSNFIIYKIIPLESEINNKKIKMFIY